MEDYRLQHNYKVTRLRVLGGRVNRVAPLLTSRDRKVRENRMASSMVPERGLFIVPGSKDR